MIKSDKNREIFYSDSANCDGNITDYILGAKVHFNPEISTEKYENAKKVSRL
ncbi:TPA: hypothetical protein ACPY5O_003475 [Yersinia enterocolitica]